jgi:hypothetical protein
MTSWSYRRWRVILSVLSLVFVALFVCRTWHWPLVGDAPLMHYVVFLMDHGLAPYRDIVDPNMPGTYLIQGAVIHLFGGGALTWRIFDLFLLALCGSAMVAIALPYDWFAGVFAATLFALIHGRDGLIDLGQRDLMMTVFLLWGYVFLFKSVRSESEGHSRWLTGLFGLCIGAATTVKPPALLFGIALPILLAIAYKKRWRQSVVQLACGAIGFALPCVLVLAFLVRWHATADFIDTVKTLVPALTVLGRRSFPHLLWHSISSTVLPLFFLWIPVAYVRRNVRNVERSELILGVVLGLISFYLQRKGYPYHRYPSEAFLLLLIGLDFTALLGEDGRARSMPYRLALCGTVLGVVVVGGGSLVHALRQDWHNQEFDSMLRADLMRLGGASLSGHVQCLDTNDGCIPALYNMKLVQDTGFLYDCYLLSPDVDRESEQRYRDRFWQAIGRNPPSVFVVSSYECGKYDSLYQYAKLDAWPLLNGYLRANYRLYAERIPPHLVNWGSSPSRPLGYRIYVRNSPTVMTQPAPGN